MKLKKLSAVLVALTCMLASAMPCISGISAHAESTTIQIDTTEYTYENFIYRKGTGLIHKDTGETTYNLVVTGAVDGATEIHIPEEINGEKITSIGIEAFKDCESLVSVSMPDTVTTIGKSAFENCTSLKEVNLSQKMTIIVANAFTGCTSLEKIVIPESITNISMEAFQDCTSLYDINLPENLKVLGNRAFKGCTSLESIVLPKGISELSSGVFWDCTNLKNVNIPDNVKTIEIGAFENCTSLENIRVPECVESIESNAFENTAWLNNQPDGVVSVNDFIYCYKGDMSEHTELVIPDGIRHIVSHAFSTQQNLISVTMPESLQTIGYGAFSYCKNLENIHFPNALTLIETSAFADTAWMNRQEDGIVYAGNYALLYKGEFPQQAEIVLKEGTTVIDPVLFKDKTELVSVTFPEGFKMLYGETFAGCENLSNIIIPDSIEMIGGDAFTDTPWFQNQPDGLIYVGNVAYQYKGEMPEHTEIVLKEGTVSISPYAFTKCENLESIELPDTVKDIGRYAFTGCYALKSLTLPEHVARVGNIYAISNRLMAYRKTNEFTLTVLNPDCEFSNAYVFPRGENVIMKGYENSTTQIYAETCDAQFESLGEAPEKKLLLGDVNFDETVDILDVILVNKAILGKEILTETQVKVVDFNQDGIADPGDSLTLMKLIVNLITEDELLN